VAASNLTLVIPPLTLSEPESAQLSTALEKSGKKLAGLRKILSRGQREYIDEQSTSLAATFNLPYTDVNSFPTAAIMAMGCGMDAATGYWLCADPVNLHPDLDHVVLFDSTSFELEKHELGQLVSEVNELLLENGLTSYHGRQHNLFLKMVDKPEVSFSSLESVVGKNILQHLPEGRDAAKWRLLQNEIQMQMTQSRVNSEREQRGQSVVNGLWFWGGGYLFRPKHKQVYDVIFANDLITQGFARLTDTSIEKDCAGLEDIPLGKNSLVAIDVPDATSAAWHDLLLSIEKQWLKPALAAIKKNELESITLLTGKIKIIFTKQEQGSFWKRSVKPRAIMDLL